MRAALLLLAATLPAAADTASQAHARARAAYDEAMTAMNEGKGALKDLEALKGRYAADMDAAAVGADRDALLKRIKEASTRYQARRLELLQLRKDNQGGQLERLLAGVPKGEFASGLMETLDFNRFFADIDGYPRLLETSLKADEADFAAALAEAAQARTLRMLAMAAGAVALILAAAFLLLPRRVKVLARKPDVPRLE